MDLPVETLFQKSFGAAPAHVVRAPGRLELLGNHTDYNEGLVLAIAVDKYVYLAASPRTDSRVKLVAAAFDQLSHKLDGLPQLIPSVMRDVATLSTVIADRRGQLGQLLASTATLTSTLQSQRRDLGGLFLATRATKEMRAFIEVPYGRLGVRSVRGGLHVGSG